MLKIIAIPAYEDNYIWLLSKQGYGVVIDPGDASVVFNTLNRLSISLTHILITHHHQDHVGGVKALAEHYAATIYAPSYRAYDFNHVAVKHGDKIDLKEIGITLDILWLPGHTLDHIAYVNHDYLFCGDTLFGAGCGRLFEGSPAQMLQSLSLIKKLDPNTLIYCAHEYTLKNIEFALTIDPHNQDLIQRKVEATERRINGLPTLPSTLDLELKTNPFLRCQAFAKHLPSSNRAKTEVEIFTEIRELRNHY